MASLIKRYRKKIKEYSREKLAPIMRKVAPVKTGIISTAASYFLPGAGLLTAGAGKYIGQYWGATEARGEGLSGRDARLVGRKVGDRAFKYGLIGAGVGTAAAFTVGSWWTPGIAGDIWAKPAQTYGSYTYGPGGTQNFVPGVSADPNAAAEATMANYAAAGGPDAFGVAQAPKSLLGAGAGAASGAASGGTADTITKLAAAAGAVAGTTGYQLPGTAPTPKPGSDPMGGGGGYEGAGGSGPIGSLNAGGEGGGGLGGLGPVLLVGVLALAFLGK